MSSFLDIISKPTVFKDRNVLSPSYIPPMLLFREEEIEKIMVAISPALKGQRPKNIFIYGGTGSGKTATAKHVMKKIEEMTSPASAGYLNCRVYNSRYRILQKVVKDRIPSLDKPGFGLSFLYEKLLEHVGERGLQFVIVLDEVDMIKDLDDLIYMLTRANDELKNGNISIIGISNKLDFKSRLDPRSRSSLYETEMVFAPYTSRQLQGILNQRVKMGFADGVVRESAINLAAAIAAGETGDARYALKLILRAGEIADEEGIKEVTDGEVEKARRNVDEDVASEVIATMPEHQQLVLYAVANLSISGSRYSKLGGGDEGFLMSGEVYEEYCRVCRESRKKPRSARWYREYLNDLELLGLLIMVESGRGIKGHTRLIKIAYPPAQMKKNIENNWSIVGG
jgi:cell division control protein 6